MVRRTIGDGFAFPQMIDAKLGEISSMRADCVRDIVFVVIVVVVFG